MVSSLGMDCGHRPPELCPGAELPLRSELSPSMVADAYENSFSATQWGNAATRLLPGQLAVQMGP